MEIVLVEEILKQQQIMASNTMSQLIIKMTSTLDNNIASKT